MAIRAPDGANNQIAWDEMNVTVMFQVEKIAKQMSFNLSELLHEGKMFYENITPMIEEICYNCLLVEC